MGRLSAFCISGQTWRSYVGILQRMPKPGSFASIACPLSEHLRARPKDLHLQGGTCLPVSSIVGVIHQNAGPWRRAAAKAQDGLMGFVRIPCFAGLASARRIHPPPFGLPPSLRGHVLTDFLNMFDNQWHAAFRGFAAGPQLSSLKSQFYPNHAGPWRRAAPKAQDGCGAAATPV